jgi:EAL domain-containing protein (putative c-di-GMP-specific phosphodiesterase class I)
VYTRESDQNSPRRLSLLGSLRSAVESGDLVVHYQPKAELANGKFVGVEALVRWRHPEHGLVRPDEFIGLAEQSGVIRPLTMFVLRTALEQCAAWRASGLKLNVAVNLSARTLLDASLPEDVRRLLSDVNLPGSCLTLEITESSMMIDPARTVATLGQLHAMGIVLSVDDFGTGYSSLSYLKRLPVQEVKIDRSFVMNMSTDENDAVIVRSTIDLGHNLGLRVVAEGVEDLESWHKLAELGCDHAQGYLMSRPVSAEELTPLLVAGGFAAGVSIGEQPVPERIAVPAVVRLRSRAG